MEVWSLQLVVFFSRFVDIYGNILKEKAGSVCSSQITAEPFSPLIWNLKFVHNIIKIFLRQWQAQVAEAGKLALMECKWQKINTCLIQSLGK